MSETCGAAAVLDGGARSIRCALQQQRARDPAGVLGERQRHQAFQRDPRTVEKRAGQPVQLLEAGRLQKPPSDHGAEL